MPAGRGHSGWALQGAPPLGVLAVLALGGCSSSSTHPAAATSAPLRIVATDNGYECRARTPSGLTHVLFENRDTTIHEAMFIRLPEGMSAADYIAAVKGGQDFPEGALDCSGPGLTSPGEKLEMWLRLDPGEYLLGCWFRGHLQSAPIQALTVTADSTRGVEPPAPDATVRLADFEFQLDGDIRFGPRTLRIEAAGPSMHEMDIFMLDNGKRVDDLRVWMKNHKRGDAPGTAMGGVLDSHDLNRVVWLRREFVPGRYVMWCGMDMVPNVEVPGGGTHADAGMVHEFEVVMSENAR